MVFHYSSLGENNFDRFLVDFYLAGTVGLALLLALLSSGINWLATHKKTDS